MEAVVLIELISKVITLALGLSEGGPAAWIISGIITVLLGGGFVFAKFWFKGKTNKAAMKESELQGNKAIEDVARNNTKLNTDIKSSENEIDNIYEELKQ